MGENFLSPKCNLLISKNIMKYWNNRQVISNEFEGEEEKDSSDDEDPTATEEIQLKAEAERLKGRSDFS